MGLGRIAEEFAGAERPWGCGQPSFHFFRAWPPLPSEPAARGGSAVFISAAPRPPVLPSGVPDGTVLPTANCLPKSLAPCHLVPAPASATLGARPAARSPLASGERLVETLWLLGRSGE